MAITIENPALVHDINNHYDSPKIKIERIIDRNPIPSCSEQDSFQVEGNNGNKQIVLSINIPGNRKIKINFFIANNNLFNTLKNLSKSFNGYNKNNKNLNDKLDNNQKNNSKLKINLLELFLSRQMNSIQ